ncbi:hypothetical protein Q0590_25750 [Rhodocytophaga aerolata]|uniref:DUF2281 domain-containing protein n=1 Tax=Rhodocytophaga aerolata TaxID=455078 RepID=A0ABT8RET5_9BACT|nr:hypothetical protein [Rhodocytophaga aerolata]MDO1449708.1 hypothetical protein [Rhodocytophaga aerolata]
MKTLAQLLHEVLKSMEEHRKLKTETDKKPEKQMVYAAQDKLKKENSSVNSTEDEQEILNDFLNYYKDNSR